MTQAPAYTGAARLPHAHRSILPPASTALERTADQTFPRWDALADATEPASTNASTAHKQYIAAQWGLGQFAPYFVNVDDLLKNGVPWVLERGSAASIKRALGWLGYENVTVEEEDAYLNIDPGRIFSDSDLYHIAVLVRASIPAHVHFYRAFHAWDVRSLRLDSSPPIDNALLDDDSGTWVNFDDQAPVKGSQAQTHRACAQPPQLTPIAAATTTICTALAWRNDQPMLDAWALDSHADIGLPNATTICAPAIAPQYVQKQPHAAVPSIVVTSIAPARLATDRAGAATQTTQSARAADLFPLERRTWQHGGWDDQPWRTPIKHNTTQEQQP